MLYSKKLKLIKGKGFSYDITKGGWVFRGQVINDYYLQNPSITEEQLEMMITKLKEKAPQKTKSNKKKINKFKNEIRVDAMDRRLPGSFGTGKRR